MMENVRAGREKTWKIGKRACMLISREGPVSGNQEAAQIFIKYMYDIVLEISFLDINDWPNLSRSNRKLLQKSVKM